VTTQDTTFFHAYAHRKKYSRKWASNLKSCHHKSDTSRLH